MNRYDHYTDKFITYPHDTQYGILGTDLISKQAAIAELNAKYHGMISDESMKIYQIINWLDNLPSAERAGKWIYHTDNLFPTESTMECDRCHAVQPMTCDDNFCPNCGARMTEGANDNVT